MAQHKFILDEKDLPTRWYNIQADLPFSLPPVIHPGTKRPIGPQDLAPLLFFDAALQFARTEGILSAPEPAHAIRVVIDEALRCKESGERKVIGFVLCGHGHTLTWGLTTPICRGTYGTSSTRMQRSGRPWRPSRRSSKRVERLDAMPTPSLPTAQLLMIRRPVRAVGPIYRQRMYLSNPMPCVTLRREAFDAKVCDRARYPGSREAFA